MRRTIIKHLLTTATGSTKSFVRWCARSEAWTHRAGVSFARRSEPEVADEPDEATPEAPEISGYQTITDDTDVLTVDVPIEWADRDTAPFTVDDGHGAATTGSRRRRRSPSSRAAIVTPGLMFMALPPKNHLTRRLPTFAPAEGECTDEGVEDYERRRSTRVFSRCSRTAMAPPPGTSRSQRCQRTTRSRPSCRCRSYPTPIWKFSTRFLPRSP